MLSSTWHLKKTAFNCSLGFTRSSSAGVDPVYSKINSGYKTYHHDRPFFFKYNDGVVPQLEVAYETWGELNEAKDNVVLLCTGLSASSHANSHSVSTLFFTHQVLSVVCTDLGK